jgi:hypothetical protein
MSAYLHSTNSNEEIPLRIFLLKILAMPLLEFSLNCVTKPAFHVFLGATCKCVSWQIPVTVMGKIKFYRIPIE